MQYMLTIENYLKVEKAEIPLNPGVVGLVGENAQGKTTIINALQELLAGKNDFSKVRNGADRAVIKLDAIDNGDVVSSVQRVQTEGGSRLEAKGLRIGHTATTFLSSILNEVAINPINLIDSDPVSYLKKHLDVGVDPNDYPESAKALLSQLPDGVGGFNAAELVAKKLEEDRLFTRKQMEQVQSVLKDLRAGMPSEKPIPPNDTVEDINAEATTLEAEKTEIAVKQERKTNAWRKHSEAVESQNRQKSMVAALEGQKNELLMRLERMNAEIAGYNKSILELDTVVKDTKEFHDSITVPTAEDIQARAIALKARLEAIKSYQATVQRFEVVEKRQLEAETLAAKFDQQDEDVKRIKYEIPKALLLRCDLGVEGIEIRDGQLFVNGFHIERLSTAERAVATVKIAIAIAKRKGHVAVCLDGIECLDASHRSEFLKAAEESGVCVLYTRMGKAELPFEKEVKDGKVLT